MMSAEGGVEGLVRRCEQYVALEFWEKERPNLFNAFIAFRRDLVNEYGSQLSENKNYRFSPIPPGDESPETLRYIYNVPSEQLNSIPSEPLHVDSEFFYLTAKEQETLDVLMSTLSVKDVAEYLGIERRAAEMRVYRLRKKLRPILAARL